MDQKLIATGLVTLIVGFALGTLSAPGLDDIGGRIDQALTPTSESLSSGLGDIGDRIDSGVSGVSEQITALTERLDQMEAKLDETATAAADSSGLDDLAQRIDALSGDIGDSLGQAQSDIAAQIAGLGDRMSSAAPAAPAAAPADSDEPADDTAGAAPDLMPADNATPPQGLTAGSTAMLGDGSVRVFVSMVGDGMARVMINGDMASLSAGESTQAGDCLVTLNAVDRGHADISGVCGAEIPPAEGFRPGEVALFDEGAARVFISGISQDNSAVRIALNGLTTQSVAAGESVPVGGDSSCSVVVEGIDRGHVQLGYACGS